MCKIETEKKKKSILGMCIYIYIAEMCKIETEKKNTSILGTCIYIYILLKCASEKKHEHINARNPPSAVCSCHDSNGPTGTVKWVKPFEKNYPRALPQSPSYTLTSSTCTLSCRSCPRRNLPAGAMK